MIKTITNTTFTLGAIAVMNFILVATVSKILLKEGVSEMGLIVLGISFIVMINNLVGGSSLVYLASRKSVKSLLKISYSWAIFSSLFMSAILYIFDLAPREYIIWILVIGFFECVFSIHNQLFIGKEKMKFHNSLKLIQKITQVVLFLVIEISIHNFVFSLLLSYLAVLVFSFVFLFKLENNQPDEEFKVLFKTAFNYGFQIQSSNIVQLLNYRLLYFIIDKTMGSVLGIFIVAVQLAESLWIPSKALAIIQYGKVANEENETKRKSLSLKFLKLSFFGTLGLFLILVFIPESWILFFFGDDVKGVQPIIIALGLGVISIAINQSFSHYLSGKGIYHYLIKASAIGLITLIAFGWILINQYELIGAGLATSLSYFASTLYLGYAFLKESKISFSEFYKINQ
ncbi:MAG: polysaccharide biosynthesis C-terminal domain-containing protein [Flavobacteriales bacterium]